MSPLHIFIEFNYKNSKLILYKNKQSTKQIFEFEELHNVNHISQYLYLEQI